MRFSEQTNKRYPLFNSVICRRTWLFHDMFVAENRRRHGVGGLLMETVERFARVDGGAQVMLQTAETNTTAQSLYEGRGWKHDVEYRTYYLDLL
jgi:GNAT superfamily N-acetyltransferase